jgi:Spy/CpxP family protein refolding chaperone
MKTKILVPALIVAGLSVAVASTFAATGTETPSSSAPKQVQGFGFGGMGGHRGGHMLSELTDAEKTTLESMSATEKQAFFEKKRAEMEAKHDAREAVVDKLLAGTALTADEEVIRQAIIKERAERKAERAKMEAIRSKLQAGTTLTTEEQALVDSMPR